MRQCTLLKEERKKDVSYVNIIILMDDRMFDMCTRNMSLTVNEVLYKGAVT